MFVTNGTFLLIGSTIDPQIHGLTPLQHKSLIEGLSITSRYERDSEHGQSMRADVYKKTFGVAAEYAIPAWSDEAMTAVATGYVGPKQDAVRGLAACIVTRTIIGPNYGCDAFDFELVKGEWVKTPRADGKGPGPKGGRKAKLTPDKPAPKHPGGTAARLLFGDAAEAEAMQIESHQR